MIWVVHMYVSIQYVPDGGCLKVKWGYLTFCKSMITFCGLCERILTFYDCVYLPPLITTKIFFNFCAVILWKNVRGSTIKFAPTCEIVHRLHPPTIDSTHLQLTPPTYQRIPFCITSTALCVYVNEKSYSNEWIAKFKATSLNWKLFNQQR